MRLTALVAAVVTGCAAPAPFDFSTIEGGVPPAGANAELVRKDAWSVDDAVQLADAMNPRLEIERRGIDLATAAIWEAKLWPNPSGLLEVEDYAPSEGFGDSKRMAGVRVPLVVGGRVGAATSLAETEREIAALRYVWRRREILADVRRAFVAALAARHVADLAREARAAAKALHDVTEERFKAQAVPEMELLKAAVGLAKTEVDVRSADRDVAVATKALHAAVGNADLTIEKLTGALATKYAVPSFEAVRGHVLVAHPLTEIAAKGREAAERELALARAERIPDIGVEVKGGRDADESIIEAGIEIPIPLFNRNQAKVARAEIRVRQAEAEVAGAKSELVAKLTEAYRTFVAAQERATIYADEILPKAARALEQTVEGRRLGKFGYLDVLDAQRTLSDARAAHSAALADLNLAAVELEKLTGAKLEVIR